MSFRISLDLDLHSAMVYIYLTVSPIFRHWPQLKVSLSRLILKINSYKGTHYEIGLKRGREIGELPMPMATKRDSAYALECLREAEKLYAPLVESYEGMIKGGGFDRGRFTFYFFARREGVIRGCTGFAALPPVTRNRAVIVGRNYDWVYSDLKWCELRHIHSEGVTPFISYSHHWAGHPDCLNEKGLCVIISSLPRREPAEPGLQWNLLVDTIAETCSSVEEAEQVLTSVYHLRSMAYLITDSYGRAVVVEAKPGNVKVRRPENGVLISTNHMLGDEDVSECSRHSRIRYEYTEGVLRERIGEVDETLAEEILSDHHCTICAGIHGGNPDEIGRREGWGTIWSTICRPDKRILKVAPGHPCEVGYETIRFEDVSA